MITILTPTYNRANLLPRLFESLKNQTAFDFEWLIIDDGSTDNTQDIVSGFTTEKFSIYYHYKENGGKHTAMNYSHPYINGDLVAIVDSDDYLFPNAVDCISQDWAQYQDHAGIGMFSYQRITTTNKIVSTTYVDEYFIGDEIITRTNGVSGGDRFEVVRTDVFTKYTLPVFPGEKFMSEGWLWREIAKNFQTVYINHPIYVCEYLTGGLTKSGRLFRMNNPYGMMENCKSFMVPQIRLRIKTKQVLAFGVYGFCAGLKCVEIIRRSEMSFVQALMLPFSYFLYRKWAIENDFRRK